MRWEGSKHVELETLVLNSSEDATLNPVDGDIQTSWRRLHAQGYPLSKLSGAVRLFLK